jgi:hypothetical protein
MIDVVESDDPPLRLRLGADAIGAWEQKHAAFLRELQRWRAAGKATAFEGRDHADRRLTRRSLVGLPRSHSSPACDRDLCAHRGGYQ